MTDLYKPVINQIKGFLDETLKIAKQVDNFDILSLTHYGCHVTKEVKQANESLVQQGVDTGTLEIINAHLNNFYVELEKHITIQLEKCTPIETANFVEEKAVIGLLTSMPENNRFKKYINSVLAVVKGDVCEEYVSALQNKSLDLFVHFMRNKEKILDSLGIDIDNIFISEHVNGRIDDMFICTLHANNLLSTKILDSGILTKLSKKAQVRLFYDDNVFWYDLDVLSEAEGVDKVNNKAFSFNPYAFEKAYGTGELNNLLRDILTPLLRLKHDLQRGVLENPKDYVPRHLELPTLYSSISLFLRGDLTVNLFKDVIPYYKNYKLAEKVKGIMDSPDSSLLGDSPFCDAVVDYEKSLGLFSAESFKFISSGALLHAALKGHKAVSELTIPIVLKYLENVSDLKEGESVSLLEQMRQTNTVNTDFQKALYSCLYRDISKGSPSPYDVVTPLHILATSVEGLVFCEESLSEITEALKVITVDDYDSFKYILKLFSTMEKGYRGNILSEADVEFLKSGIDIIQSIDINTVTSKYTSTLDKVDRKNKFAVLLDKTPKASKEDIKEEGYPITDTQLTLFNTVGSNLKTAGLSFDNVTEQEFTVVLETVKVLDTLQTKDYNLKTISNTLNGLQGYTDSSLISLLSQMVQPTRAQVNNALKEQERLEQERLEQERLEQERLERERLEQERLEQERRKQEEERLKQEQLNEGNLPTTPVLGGIALPSLSLPSFQIPDVATLPTKLEPSGLKEENNEGKFDVNSVQVSAIPSLNIDINSKEEGSSVPSLDISTLTAVNEKAETPLEVIESPIVMEEPSPVVEETPITPIAPQLTFKESKMREQERGLFDTVEEEEQVQYAVVSNVQPNKGLPKDTINAIITNLVSKAPDELVTILTDLCVNRGNTEIKEVREIATEFAEFYEATKHLLASEVDNPKETVNKIEGTVKKLRNYNMHNTDLYREVIALGERLTQVSDLFTMVNKYISLPSLEKGFIQLFRPYLEKLQEQGYTNQRDVESLSAYISSIANGQADISYIDDYVTESVYFDLLNLSKTDIQSFKSTTLESTSQENNSTLEINEEQPTNVLSFDLDSIEEETKTIVEKKQESNYETFEEFVEGANLLTCSELVGRDLLGENSYYKEALDYIKINLGEQSNIVTKQETVNLLDLLEYMQHESDVSAVYNKVNSSNLQDILISLIFEFFNLKNKDLKVFKVVDSEENKANEVLYGFSLSNQVDNYFIIPLASKGKVNNYSTLLHYSTLLKAYKDDYEGILLYSETLAIKIPSNAIGLSKLIENGLNLEVVVTTDNSKLKLQFFVNIEGNPKKALKRMLKYITIELKDSSSIFAEGNIVLSNEDMPKGTPLLYKKYNHSVVFHTLVTGVFYSEPFYNVSEAALNGVASEVQVCAKELLQRKVMSLFHTDFTPSISVTTVNFFETLSKVIGVYKDNFSNIHEYGQEPLKYLQLYGVIEQEETDYIVANFHKDIVRKDMFKYLARIFNLVGVPIYEGNIDITVPLDEETLQLITLLQQEGILKTNKGDMELEGSISRQELAYYIHNILRFLGCI